jgi:hypothetical protein
MAPKLRKELKKFKLNKNDRPLIVEPDMVHLFLALGETSCNAVAMAIIVQRVAHLAKLKKLNLTTKELLDHFPFMCNRSLKRNIHKLRKYGIWKNKKYLPHTNMASYSNIRINWKSVARLARQIQDKKRLHELAKNIDVAK